MRLTPTLLHPLLSQWEVLPFLPGFLSSGSRFVSSIKSRTRHKPPRSIPLPRHLPPTGSMMHLLLLQCRHVEAGTNTLQKDLKWQASPENIVIALYALQALLTLWCRFPWESMLELPEESAYLMVLVGNMLLGREIGGVCLRFIRVCSEILSCRLKTHSIAALIQPSVLTS